MKVGIVGGGITGLAAAYALRESHEVALFERDGRLGGKILTNRVDGFLLEEGPDSFLTTKPQAVELSRALGLGDQLVGTLPGRTVYVLSRGRLYPLPDGLMLIAPTKVTPLLRSRLFSLGDKVRMAVDLLLPPRAADGDETLGAFVRRRLGQAALNRIAAPLLAGIYAGDAEQLSLQATFPQLAEVERKHGSLIAGMLAARRRAATSPNGRLPMFMTLLDGLHLLVERLAAATRHAEVRMGTEVATVAPQARGYRLELREGGHVDVDAVIVTAPAFAAANLVEPLAPGAAALLRQIPYASTATISLAYRAEDVPVHEGHGFVVARDEPARITACTWTSAKWPRRAPGGCALLRAYIGHARDPEALARSDDGLVEVAREELARSMGLTASPILARVARWPRAMPQYTLGHLDRLAELERALAPFRRVVLAGAGYRGVGLPDCIRQGTAAAVAVTS